jgi:hypothetical protein
MSQQTRVNIALLLSAHSTALSIFWGKQVD